MCVLGDDPCRIGRNGDGFISSADQSLIAARIGTAQGDANYDAFYDLNRDGQITSFDLSRVNAQIGKNCPSRFVYNGDGLRTARAGSYLNWSYVWDVASGLPVVLKERDSHNEENGHGTDNTYVYGLDLISVTDKDGNQSYFLQDGLGSTTNMTDGSGSVTASYGYDVFGDLRSGGVGVGGNEFLFTGEQRHPQNKRNLYYLRARYYDPETGRFLARDPARVGH